MSTLTLDRLQSLEDFILRLNAEAAQVMQAHHVSGRLLVVDESNRLVGALHVDDLLRAGYPGLRYAQTRRNGTLLLEVGKDTLLARYFEIDGERVGECFYDDPAALAGGILRIATNLARHKTDRQRQAVVWDQGRHAVTRARVVEGFADQAALVDCWLETGRTHQIRVHLAYGGQGLVGDPTYGGKKRLGAVLGQGAAVGNAFPRQALHAATLGFVHPVTGEGLEFSSPLPADMAGLIAALRAG